MHNGRDRERPELIIDKRDCRDDALPEGEPLGSSWRRFRANARPAHGEFGRVGKRIAGLRPLALCIERLVVQFPKLLRQLLGAETLIGRQESLQLLGGQIEILRLDGCRAHEGECQANSCHMPLEHRVNPCCSWCFGRKRSHRLRPRWDLRELGPREALSARSRGARPCNQRQSGR